MADTPDMALQRVGHKAIVNTLAVSKARKVNPKHLQAIGAHVVGVDPARFGDDSTAIIHILRITEQPGFPHSIDWPVMPTLG